MVLLFKSFLFSFQFVLELNEKQKRHCLINFEARGRGLRNIPPPFIAAHREGHGDGVGDLAHDLQEGLAPLDGRRDVQHGELVGAGGAVRPAAFDGVARVLDVHEIDALDDASVDHVEARHDGQLAVHFVPSFFFLKRYSENAVRARPSGRFGRRTVYTIHSPATSPPLTGIFCACAAAGGNATI